MKALIPVLIGIIFVFVYTLPIKTFSKTNTILPSKKVKSGKKKIKSKVQKKKPVKSKRAKRKTKDGKSVFTEPLITFYPIDKVPVSAHKSNKTTSDADFYAQIDRRHGWIFGIESGFMKFLDNDAENSMWSYLGLNVHYVFHDKINASVRICAGVPIGLKQNEGNNLKLKTPTTVGININYFILNYLYARGGVGYYVLNVDVKAVDPALNKTSTQSVNGTYFNIGVGVELQLSRYIGFFAGVDYYHASNVKVSGVTEEIEIDNMYFIGIPIGITFY